MAWTTPRTWTAGEVLTAANLNSGLRDQLNYLRSNATASVATAETVTSTTYTDLTTVGPAVTVTTDVQAVVLLYSNQSCTTADYLFMGFAVSGATTVAAADAYSIAGYSGAGRYSSSFLITGLTAGSNTFTAKYRRANTGTCTFSDRRITIIPC